MGKIFPENCQSHFMTGIENNKCVNFNFFDFMIIFSIKTEPFKIPEDDGNDLMHTFFNPDREGWLWKQGGR